MFRVHRGRLSLVALLLVGCGAAMADTASRGSEPATEPAAARVAELSFGFAYGLASDPDDFADGPLVLLLPSEPFPRPAGEPFAYVWAYEGDSSALRSGPPQTGGPVAATLLYDDGTTCRARIRGARAIHLRHPGRDDPEMESEDVTEAFYRGFDLEGCPVERALGFVGAEPILHRPDASWPLASRPIADAAAWNDLWSAEPGAALAPLRARALPELGLTLVAGRTTTLVMAGRACAGGAVHTVVVPPSGSLDEVVVVWSAWGQIREASRWSGCDPVDAGDTRTCTAVDPAGAITIRSGPAAETDALRSVPSDSEVELEAGRAGWYAVVGGGWIASENVVCR